jgi:hypothetical protein
LATFFDRHDLHGKFFFVKSCLLKNKKPAKILLKVFVFKLKILRNLQFLVKIWAFLVKNKAYFSEKIENFGEKS